MAHMMYQVSVYFLWDVYTSHMMRRKSEKDVDHMGRISTYLRVLKARTGYTQQQLSDISGVPVGTIPHYFADLDDDSANFEIVRKLVVAMDGSLDELAGIEPRQVDISPEKLSEDGYTESEIRAILRWAGSEIARNYQAIVAGLEARIAEKDQRISHRAEMLEDEHRRANDQIAYERHRARICLVVSYLALGIIVCLFAVDYLNPTMGWLQK